MLFVVLLACSIVCTADMGSGDLTVRTGPTGPPTRAIGKVVDLNTTTVNPHAENLIRIGRVPGKYTDMFQFADIDGDSHLDMVFRQINGSSTSNEDRTHILVVPGPLNMNATYTLSSLERFTLPFRIKNFIICDQNEDGRSDLIVSKKQYQSADTMMNSSFIGWNGNALHSGPVPWTEPSFTVWLDPMENRTAENVSVMDIDGDGKEDLLLQTRTWYRRRPQDFYAMPTNEYLIRNKTMPLSGRLNRTDIGTMLVAERQDSTVYGRYYLDHPLTAGNVVGGKGNELVSFERNYRSMGGSGPRGAVLIIEGPDLNRPLHLARGNVTSLVLGVVYDGSVTRNSIGVMVRDMDNDGLEDVLVTQQSLQGNLPNQFILVFKGNVTLPALWDISLIPPSTTIEGFNPLFLDHDGNGLDDLVVGYYKETVLSRSSCGILRLGLDISGVEHPITTADLASVSVMGARSNDEVGRTLFARDIDGDLREELMVLTGPQSMYIDLYVVYGLELKGPRVIEVKGMPDVCERGQTLTVEVFARDPQNYPRYLSLNLRFRVGDADWVLPKVTKTVQNFSYEFPYNGSTFLSFIVPADIMAGMADLRVRATNTYGLVSDPYIMDDVTNVLNRVPSFTEVVLYPKELFREEELTVQGTVTDTDDQTDLKGRVMLKSGGHWYSVCDLDIGASGQFTCRFAVPTNASLGPNQLMMEAWDDNGAVNRSAELTFNVIARPLECSLSVDVRSVLRGGTVTAQVTTIGELEPVFLDLELKNGSHKVSVDHEVGLGNSSMNVTVPLNLSVGLYTLDLFATDGVWSASSSLDGQIEVKNNRPVLTGPMQFSLNGLSGELDLRDRANDLEDGTNLQWSLKGTMDQGINAYFRDPSGLLFVDLSDNRTRSLTVTVSDNDGGSVDAVVEVSSKWKAPPLFITVKVMGSGEQPLEGSNITLSLDGRQIADGMTEAEGMTEMEVPRAGTYTVSVTPPPGIAYIENTRAGYLPFEGELEVDIQTLLYEVTLIYKTPPVVKLSSLSVTVKDQDGMPIEGANVSLRGPANITLGTDPSGSVLFKDLTPGNYSVKAFMDSSFSEERTIVVGHDQYLTLELVIDLGADEMPKDDFPFLPLIGGSLLVGLLLGMLFLYMMGAFRKDKGTPEE